MDWPNGWGTQEWSAAAAIIAALIAIAALIVNVIFSFRSERRQDELSKAAHKSATAAEVSAGAAKRTVAIQEEQHIYSRMARLHIYDAYTYVIKPTDTVISSDYIPFIFKVKNLGGTEAFNLETSLKSDFRIEPRSPKKNSLHPQEEGEFGGEFNRTQALGLSNPSRVILQLAYQDASGPHILEAVFEMTFEMDKKVKTPITSMRVDGKHSENYTNSTIA